MQTLPHDPLVQISLYLDAIDLRAMALVSRFHNSIQDNQLVWESLFRTHWNRCNFYMDPNMPIELSPALRAAYPRPSDAFRFLTHCVERVPSFADICLTNAHATSSVINHRIEPVAYDNGQVVTLALAKDAVGGGNRCVRANVPFKASPRVTVFNTVDGKWLVDVLYDGYFEISISEPLHQPTRDLRDMCIAIGVATKDFEVVDQQPGIDALNRARLTSMTGWDDHSYGYHSDDGQFFTNGQPRPFAMRFGVHDTIGCGIVRKMNSNESTIYFTKNGVRLEPSFPCSHEELFPVVGIDAEYTVRLNCGRTPFQCPPPTSGDVCNAALKELQGHPWPNFHNKPRSIVDHLWSMVNSFVKSVMPPCQL
ncbi:unnamed protein product [Aphanomyces euteiches]